MTCAKQSPAMPRVFVCHYTPLTDRKAALREQLDAFGIHDVEWVTEAALEGIDVEACYDGSQETFRARRETAFAAFNYTEYTPLARPCIELTLQHLLAYRRIVEQGLDSAIVFEDDVLLGRQFTTRLRQYCDELPPDWDVFYFGAGCSASRRSRMSLRDRLLCWLGRKHVFLRRNHQSRWADSYMMRHRAAEKILATAFPFQFPIDWELNYQQTIHALNVYWAEPPITRQGSGWGRYKSSLAQSAESPASK